MKKLGSALCLATVLWVGTANAQWERNWLLGVSVGYADQEATLGLYEPANPLATAGQGPLDDNLFTWGVFTGYQAVCNNWLYGLELNMNWFYNEKTHRYGLITAFGAPGGVATARYDADTQIGITGRIGYQFTDYFMTYVRAGVEGTREELSFTARDNASSVFVNAFGRRNVINFVGGVGVELPILLPQIENLSFRMQYDYHASGKVVGATGVASDGVTFVFASARPHANTVSAAFVYNIYVR